MKLPVYRIATDCLCTQAHLPINCVVIYRRIVLTITVKLYVDLAPGIEAVFHILRKRIYQHLKRYNGHMLNDHTIPGLQSELYLFWSFGSAKQY